MGIKTKTSDVRYLTYFLVFPGGKDFWVQQTPFIHDLQFEMKNWHGLNKDPKIVRDILHKGETHWKDHNGLEHRLVIESTKRQTRWGKNQ